MAHRRAVSAKAWAEDALTAKKARTAAEVTSRKKPVKKRKPRLDPSSIKPAAFYVPESLDLNSLLGADRWQGAYFLNLIRWRRVTWRSDAEGYSHLHYGLLTKVIARDALKRVKEKLIEAKVVECDGLSRRGVKAFGYKVTDGHQATKRVVCTDAKLNRKIAEFGAREDGINLPVLRWLKGKMESLRLNIAKAHSAISAFKLTAKGKKEFSTVEDFRKSRRDYCDSFTNGDGWFTRDVYGRVHTFITALERDLCPCLSVKDGDKELPLVEIDLANSQPLLLCLMVGQFLTSTRWAKERLMDRSFGSKADPYQSQNKALGGGRGDKGETHPTTPTRIKNARAFITPSQANDLQLSTPAHLPDDLLASLAVCERGKFYESLMTEAEKAKGAKFRGRLKKRFYGVLFGKNATKGRFRSVIKGRFGQRHPTLAKVLKQLKCKNYKHSSHLLQNFEATVFIHRMCGRIMKERPSIPLFTKHDSLLTTPEYADYISTIMTEELNKIGVSPTLKRKVLS